VVARNSDLSFQEIYSSIIWGWRSILMFVIFSGVAFFLFPREAVRTYQASASLEVLPHVVCSRLVFASLDDCPFGADQILHQLAGEHLGPEISTGLFGDPVGLEPEPAELSEVSGLERAGMELTQVNLGIDGLRIKIDVEASSDYGAVVQANTVAGWIAERINRVSQRNVGIAEQRALALLSNLPELSELRSPAAGVIALDRADLQAQLQLIAEVRAEEADAAMIVDLATTSTEFAVNSRYQMGVLGGFLGLIFGSFFSVGRSIFLGRVSGSQAIAEAFDENNVVNMPSQAPGRFQELRLAIGNPDEGIVAVAGPVDNETLLAICIGLSCELAELGDIAVIDFSGIFSKNVKQKNNTEFNAVSLTASNISTYSAIGVDVRSYLEKVNFSEKIVILILPFSELGLPSLHAGFSLSTARIILSPYKYVHFDDIRRIKLAERDANGQRVLVLV
jgi:hypothetical protein